MKIKVCVLGASGRMGKSLLSELQASADLLPYCGISRSGSAPGYLLESTKISKATIADCDVIIDFSSPSTLNSLLAELEGLKIPLVSGVTGYEEAEMKKLSHASSDRAILWSPNMSLGINLFIKIIGMLKPIAHWNFQIEETHHNQKKDAPSGTAIYLQKALSEISNLAPPPLSIRGGGVIGDHSLLAISQSEMIKIEHRALDRSLFSQGALVAARWILDKKPGLYSMQNVLSSFREDDKTT